MLAFREATMRYELYIRMPEFADLLTDERAQTALSAAGFDAAAALPRELDLGGETLLAEAFRHEEHPPERPDALDGLNLSFPMGSSDEQGDRAIAAVFALAQDLGAQVFDPQLGQLVSAADHDQIARAWKRGFEFQADVVGAVGLGHGAPNAAAGDPPGMGSRLKYMLALAGVLIVVILLFRSCLANYIQDHVYAPLPSAHGGGMDQAQP